MHTYGLWACCVLVAFRLQSTRGFATTDTECSGEGEMSKSFIITCRISGSISSGIVWTRPDTRRVGTCDPEGQCTIVVDGYHFTAESTALYKMNIDKLNPEDRGSWQCQDGGGIFTKGCNLIISPSPTTATPDGGGGTSTPGDVNGAMWLKGDIYTSITLLYLTILTS